MIGSYFNRYQAILATLLMSLLILTLGPVGLVRSAIPVLIEVSPSDDVALRLGDIDYALAGNFEVSYTSENLTTIEARAQRLFWNIKTFFSNPIIGSSSTNEYGAFHLFWLYLFASLGLLGALPLIAYVFINVKNTAESLPGKRDISTLLV
jgi:hypothetical protein